jgi:DNA repair protein RadC
VEATPTPRHRHPGDLEPADSGGIECAVSTLALASPREVFQRAVLTGSISIIVAHNHPSGDTVPSSEDRAVTRRLQDAGKILAIPVLDHIIVTGKSFLSLKEDECW